MAIFSAIGAIAAGIGSAIAAVSGFIGGLGAIGTFALQTVAGIGLNLLSKALAGKPEQPTFSIQGKIQAGGDVARSFPIGWTATAGSLVYANTWGNDGKTPNAYLTQVIALADLPVGGLAGLWVNGENVALPAMTGSPPTPQGWPIAAYTKDGKAHLWIKFYDGTQTAADSFLTTRVSGPDRGYQSTRVGTGVAYAIITALVNEELFTGFPAFKFELNGIKLYDPSKDTTAGGSGTHRWTTPSSWGGDGDHLPAVQIYNLLRGVTYGDKWFYGLQGMSGARLPAAHWISQIAKCRAVIKSGGANVPTYRAGGEITISAPIANAIEALLTTCQGRVSEAGGTYKVFLGTPGAPVMSFDDGHIISTEEQSFTPFFGLADTINGIAAKYPNPAEGWNAKVAPPIYRADLEVLAGNRRLMADVSLDLVPYGDQVQRLMKSSLDEAQRARRHTYVLPPEFWVLEPGDVVSWTSERNGYVNKLFRVDGVIDRANLDVMVDLTEIDPADYDWDDDTDYRVPTDGPVMLVRPTPQPIAAWNAEGVVDIIGGKQRACILLSWDGDQDDVDRVQWEIRRADNLEIVTADGTDSVERGAALISHNIFSLTAYQARGRYIAISGRPMLWSDWLAVTTPDAPFSDIIAYLANLQKEVRDYLQDRQREFEEAFERLEFLAANTGSANAEDIVQRQHFIKQLGNTSAQILRESELRADGDSALASDLLLVEAKADGGTAQGLMQWTASAGPAGYTTRFSIMGKATAGSTYRIGGMFMDVSSTQARFTFNADQFIITDGSVNGTPFVYEGSVLKVANVRLGTLRFDRLLSNNSKLDIRGDGANASIEITT